MTSQTVDTEIEQDDDVELEFDAQELANENDRSILVDNANMMMDVMREVYVDRSNMDSYDFGNLMETFGNNYVSNIQMASFIQLSTGLVNEIQRLEERNERLEEQYHEARERVIELEEEEQDGSESIFGRILRGVGL